MKHSLDIIFSILLISPIIIFGTNLRYPNSLNIASYSEALVLCILASFLVVSSFWITFTRFPTNPNSRWLRWERLFGISLFPAIAITTLFLSVSSVESYKAKESIVNNWLENPENYLAHIEEKYPYYLTNEHDRNLIKEGRLLCGEYEWGGKLYPCDNTKFISDQFTNESFGSLGFILLFTIFFFPLVSLPIAIIIFISFVFFKRFRFKKQ